ncbi:aminotransferase class I/II-fold pyridoxal phosphate-dependent enzyme [Metapseudomonas sp. CR1201]
MLNQLTDYELVGLRGGYNLSDGHAYHDINESFPDFPLALLDIWKDSESTRVNLAEQRFKASFSKLIGSDALASSSNFKVSPTASNSIDLVAAYLAVKAPRVLLVSPTFDNLALLLRRRGCKLRLIEDGYFRSSSNSARLFERLDSLDFDTLFLVNPNNPTGTVIGREYMSLIAEYCAQRRKTLVLDATFRIYANELYDDRLVLEQSGCDYFVIDDTGKTWPTHDMKASLISYSRKCAELFELIYDEVYLCHSRFTMLVFERLFEQTFSQGISKSIHDPVRVRHSYLLNRMNNTIAIPTTDRTSACLPLEWFQVKSGRIADLDIVEYLAVKDVHVLPGRFFYWEDGSRPPCTAFRVSLSRTKQKLYKSVEHLRAAIVDFEHERIVESANVFS